jgi:hypothetical protein
MNIIKWIFAIWLAMIAYPFIVMFLGWAIWIVLFVFLVTWIKDILG